MVKVSGVTRAQLIRLLEAAEDGPSSRYEVKLPSSSGSLKQASFSVTLDVPISELGRWVAETAMGGSSDNSRRRRTETSVSPTFGSRRLHPTRIVSSPDVSDSDIEEVDDSRASGDEDDSDSSQEENAFISTSAKRFRSSPRKSSSRSLRASRSLTRGSRASTSSSHSSSAEEDQVKKPKKVKEKVKKTTTPKVARAPKGSSQPKPSASATLTADDSPELVQGTWTDINQLQPDGRIPAVFSLVPFSPPPDGRDADMEEVDQLADGGGDASDAGLGLDLPFGDSSSEDVKPGLARPAVTVKREVNEDLSALFPSSPVRPGSTLPASSSLARPKSPFPSDDSSDSSSRSSSPGGLSSILPSRTSSSHPSGVGAPVAPPIPHPHGPSANVEDLLDRLGRADPSSHSTIRVPAQPTPSSHSSTTGPSSAPMVAPTVTGPSFRPIVRPPNPPPPSAHPSSSEVPVPSSSTLQEPTPPSFERPPDVAAPLSKPMSSAHVKVEARESTAFDNPMPPPTRKRLRADESSDNSNEERPAPDAIRGTPTVDGVDMEAEDLAKPSKKLRQRAAKRARKLKRLAKEGEEEEKEREKVLSTEAVNPPLMCYYPHSFSASLIHSHLTVLRPNPTPEALAAAGRSIINSLVYLSDKVDHVYHFKSLIYHIFAGTPPHLLADSHLRQVFVELLAHSALIDVSTPLRPIFQQELQDFIRTDWRVGKKYKAQATYLQVNPLESATFLVGHIDTVLRSEELNGAEMNKLFRLVRDLLPLPECNQALQPMFVRLREALHNPELDTGAKFVLKHLLALDDTWPSDQEAWDRCQEKLSTLSDHPPHHSPLPTDGPPSTSKKGKKLERVKSSVAELVSWIASEYPNSTTKGIGPSLRLTTLLRIFMDRRHKFFDKIGATEAFFERLSTVDRLQQPLTYALQNLVERCPSEIYHQRSSRYIEVMNLVSHPHPWKLMLSAHLRRLSDPPTQGEIQFLSSLILPQAEKLEKANCLKFVFNTLIKYREEGKLDVGSRMVLHDLIYLRKSGWKKAPK